MFLIKVPDDMKRGTLHKTHQYGDIEILSYESAGRVKVRFKITGSTKYVTSDCVRKGSVKDEEGVPVAYLTGTIFPTTKSGDIEILQYISYKEVYIRFLQTGNEKNTTVGQILKGTVLDFNKYEVGTKYNTKRNGEFVITEYYNAHKIGVRFLNTGYETYTNSAQIADGNVKDVLLPRYYGVGFVGEGKYTPTRDNFMKSCHSTWNSMLMRCYAQNTKNKNPTYAGCSVVECWHNFQNFAKWYKENYIEGYYLDKDILFTGNRVYSPTTCVFVPREINNFLTERQNHRGNCPLGVHVDTESGKYVGQINNPFRVGGKTTRQFLGYFPSKKSAHIAWAEAKMEIALKYNESGLLDYDKRIGEALVERYRGVLLAAQNWEEDNGI